jgi:hypothetical protein
VTCTDREREREKVDFHELEFHFYGVLKEDKQEINSSQVMETRNGKVKVLEVMNDVIVVSHLNLFVHDFRLLISPAFYIHYSSFILCSLPQFILFDSSNKVVVVVFLRKGNSLC